MRDLRIVFDASMVRIAEDRRGNPVLLFNAPVDEVDAGRVVKMVQELDLRDQTIEGATIDRVIRTINDAVTMDWIQLAIVKEKD